MDQCLRASALLAEDLGWVPNSHMLAHKRIQSQVLQHISFLFLFLPLCITGIQVMDINNYK